MIRVGDIEAWMERIAPRRWAEEWDNVGLLWGDADREATGVLTCLTITSEVAAEAIAHGFEVIVAHHPLPFRPLKAVTRSDHRTRILWDLARAGISVISRHTAYDNAPGGGNDVIAQRLGLAEVRGLCPGPRSERAQALKLIVFTPEDCLERVSSAAFAAGAGVINEYSGCSFRVSGIGTFMGSERSNPAVGERSRREEVPELRLEMICPGDAVQGVIAAVRRAHTYEEPAIDVYALEAQGPADAHPGVGRVGLLPQAQSLGEFAQRVAGALEAPALQFVGDAAMAVASVAIVCGAGDDYLASAARAGASVLVTGEARFHRALEARELGIGLITAGHHASERPGVVDLAARLEQAFPELRAVASEVESDPLQPLAT